MPHKYYHGRTGVIWNVTPRAVGVEVTKRVNTRIVLKRFHVRIEHVKPSKCRDDFLARRKTYADIKKETKDQPKEKRQILKRIPKQPAYGKFVHIPKTGISTLTPARYVVLL
jgi:large subunit ribosomal protein L21e